MQCFFAIFWHFFKFFWFDKSTLINLVPRFYDVTDGEVLINGVNVKNYKLEHLHNKLGYVPQKAVMFNGSIKYNVSYGDSGKNITIDKVLLFKKAFKNFCI